MPIYNLLYIAASYAVFSSACIFSHVDFSIKSFPPSSSRLCPWLAIIAANLANDLAEAWNVALGNSDFLIWGRLIYSAAFGILMPKKIDMKI